MWHDGERQKAPWFQAGAGVVLDGFLWDERGGGGAGLVWSRVRLMLFPGQGPNRSM